VSAEKGAVTTGESIGAGAHAVVRAAGAADIAGMMQIRAAVTQNRLADPGSIGAGDYARFVEAGCCWVADAGGHMSGFAALDADTASVWALFVTPDAEGRGIGRALLARLVEEARQRRLRKLTLTTEPGSRAEALYRRAGWAPCGACAAGEVHMWLPL
jgi:GNAT superfamily N-acetyltransferase